MNISQLLTKFRRGRTVVLKHSAITGTIDGTGLQAEQWGWSPRRSALVLIVRIRLIENGRYTGATVSYNSRHLDVV